MRKQFAGILMEEIGFWNPTKIIAVGKVAGKALNAVTINTGTKTGTIPHPNARLSKVKKLSELKNAAGL